MRRKSSFRKPTPLIYFTKFKEEMKMLQGDVQNYNKRQNIFYGLNTTDEPSFQKKNYQEIRKQSNQSLVNAKNSKKMLLKKMTEPKYHHSVIRHLSEKEKEWAAFRQSTVLRKKTINNHETKQKWVENCQIDKQNGVSPFGVQNNSLRPQNKMNEKLNISQILKCQKDQQNIDSNIWSSVGNLKINQNSKIRISIQKKQQRLQREWEKTQKYKNNLNITERIENQGLYSRINLRKSKCKTKRQKEIIDKVKSNRPQSCLHSYCSRIDTDYMTVQNSRRKAITNPDIFQLR